MDSWLEALPSARTFLIAGGAGFLLLGGAAHALRRTAFVRVGGDLLEKGLRGLVAAILLAMVFLSALQILLRNLFDSGLLWIDPLLRHFVLLLALVGAILATGLKRHVQINVLGRLVTGTAGRLAGAAVAFVAAGVTLALTHASLLLLADEREFAETLFLGIPSWMVVFVFPVAFFAMTWRFVRMAFLEISGEAPLAGEDAAAAGDSGLSDEYPTLKPGADA